MDGKDGELPQINENQLILIQGLFRHPRRLYKYYSVSKDYALELDTDNGIKGYQFSPNIPRKEWKSGEKIVDKWKTIVLDGALYCTSPRWFNDPFDSDLPRFPDKYPTPENREMIISEIKKGIRLKSEDIRRLEVSEDFYRALDIVMSKTVSEDNRLNIIHAMKKDLPIYREMVAISCFSETNMSKLMWAHYANNFSGFCIEYDFCKPAYEGFQKQTVKVNYSNNRPRKEEGEPEDEYARQAMFTKASEWSYEKEWRFVAFRDYTLLKNEIYPVFDVKSCIVNIFLGCKIDEAVRREIVDYYSESEVNVYDMCLSDTNYDFEFELAEG